MDTQDRESGPAQEQPSGGAGAPGGGAASGGGGGGGGGGADTVGAPPPEHGGMRTYTWEWGREEDRRPQLPWVGIFLVIAGALLLVEQLANQYLVPANLVVLAAGLSFLIIWLLRRGTFALYAGAFLTASAIPGLVEGIGSRAPTGLGTLCYGLAFLFIAVIRMQRAGGIGWQAILGGALTLLGASQLALPSSADLLLPIVLVILGLVLLTRQRT